MFGQAGWKPSLYLRITLLLSVLTACGGANSPALALLTSPERNSTIDVGQPLAIVGKVSGYGVVQAMVLVDGRAVSTISDRTSTGEFVVTVPWLASERGVHVFQLKGVNQNAEAIVQSDPVFITVVGIAPTAATLSSSAPTPSQAPLPSTPPTLQPPTPTPSLASLVPAGDFVNVRSGPDTVFGTVGQLRSGQSATVRGKSSDGMWLQIDHQGGSGGVGWVFIDVVTVSGNLDSVPTKQSPPRPTFVAPTQTPRPPATPVPPPPIVEPGNHVQVGKWEYTILEVRRADGMKDYFKTKYAGGQFVVVFLQIKNLGTLGSTFSERFVVLEDNRNRIYQATESLLAHYFYGTQNWYLDEFQPGGVYVIPLAFDVARDAQGLVLRPASSRSPAMRVP